MTILLQELLIIICVVTVIAVFVVNTSANMYYYNTQNTSGVYPDVTWVGYFLLLNPAFTVLEMIISQYTSQNIISELASGLNGTMPSIFMDYWFECSIVVQLVLTFIFLMLAARFLDPLRRKEKEKSSKKRKKKKKKSGDVDD